MSLRLHLNPHFFVQRDHLYACQERAVGLKLLLHVAHYMFDNLVKRDRNVEANFVDLVPALAASQLECMLYVNEGLVDLFGKRFGELLSQSIPAAYSSLVWTLRYIDPKNTLARDFDAVIDTHSLAVVDIPPGTFAKAFIVKVLQMRHVCEE